MTHRPGHICVCICTYCRPAWLRRLLLSLEPLETRALFTYSIVVVDNDAAESARVVVAQAAEHSRAPISYCVESQRNIAGVRNKALASASGDWIAFIDDDEFATSEWLLLLYQSCEAYQASGALGPVRPHFEEEPPAWVRKSGLYERPEHTTGFLMPWSESRTGNVLFRRGILPANNDAFDLRFPNGGEDQDFFRRMIGAGHRFIWCNEAVVYETVPPVRWDKKTLLKRALLRGKNSLRQSPHLPWGRMAKSTLAIAFYALLLPLVALIGTHLVMRYAVKLCDHLGLVLASVRLNRISQRSG